MSNNTSVICLGEVLYDLLAPPGEVFAQVQSWDTYPGGAPANVACALVKLGTPSAFIGCVGNDSLGTQLIEVLSTEGVNIEGIQRYDGAPTRQVYVLRSQEGDRHFLGFGNFPCDEFADAYLQKDLLPVNLFEWAEFLVFGTISLAYRATKESLKRALELAELYNLKVVLDVNWRPMFWKDTSRAQQEIKGILKYVDFLKLSAQEAQWLFDTQDAGAIAYRLDTLEGVIVTDGEKQVSYCLGDHEGKIQPFAVEVKDTTGAGDSFLAGFIHQVRQHGIASLSNPEIAKTIITYACAVGSLTTTKLGAIAAQPLACEVNKFLA